MNSTLMSEDLLYILEKQDRQSVAGLGQITTDYAFTDEGKNALIRNLRASLATAVRPLRLLYQSGSFAVKELVREALTQIEVNDLLEWPVVTGGNNTLTPTNWSTLHGQYELDTRTIAEAGLSLRVPFDYPEVIANNNSAALEIMVRANYDLAHRLAEMIRLDAY